MNPTFVVFIVFIIVAPFIYIGLEVLRNQTNKSRRRTATRRDDEYTPVPRTYTTIAAVALGVIVLIPLIASMLTIVPTRSIGVVTTFQKPAGQELSNGLHFKAPWSKVSELDGAIQVEQHAMDGDKKGSSQTARLGNSSQANVDYTVRWQIKREAADDLFLNYKTFDRIKSNLVDVQTASAINDVMATYNPLTSATKNDAQNEVLAGKILAQLKERTGKEINFLSFNLPLIHYDADTQGKLNAINAQVAATERALKEQDTNRAQSEANKLLQDQGQLTDQVLRNKCLDIVRETRVPLICQELGASPTVPVR